MLYQHGITYFSIRSKKVPLPFLRRFSHYFFCRQQFEQILHGVKYLARIRNRDPRNISWMDPNVKPYTRKRVIGESISASSNGAMSALGGTSEPLPSPYEEEGDNVKDKEEDSSLLINFRELLWYWLEYYTRRGRDRLSLEFSSHVRFCEWKAIVGQQNLNLTYPLRLLSPH
jgi:hypothetical protein